MRYRNGAIMAKADKEAGNNSDIDYVGGVPDSGTPHAIGYSNETHLPFARAFIKYTPTWARSFMPTTQEERNKVAKMLHDAWKSRADEFVVPQDNLPKSDVELFEDFCEKHGLTCVSINELGYTPQDTARNAKIWKTTSDFERRNILVATDNCDAYSASLKKWKALQPA